MFVQSSRQNYLIMWLCICCLKSLLEMGMSWSTVAHAVPLRKGVREVAESRLPIPSCSSWTERLGTDWANMGRKKTVPDGQNHCIMGKSLVLLSPHLQIIQLIESNLCFPCERTAVYPICGLASSRAVFENCSMEPWSSTIGHQGLRNETGGMAQQARRQCAATGGPGGLAPHQSLG